MFRSKPRKNRAQKAHINASLQSLKFRIMLYFWTEVAVMATEQKVIDNEIWQTLDYEKDPRFVSYMKMRLEKAIEDRETGRLVDADVVYADIRKRYGW
jgi:hypothetical protein